MFTLDGVGEQGFELVKMLDIGDWVGVKGPMFITKAGEYTVQAKAVELLSKAVPPAAHPQGEDRGRPEDHLRRVQGRRDPVPPALRGPRP